MQYSPKLKTAMREIKEILEKYDIAAFCVLHTEGSNSQGFGEYILRLDPSYSVAKIDEAKNMVRFQTSLKNDFNGNMEHKLTNTANMLNMLAVKGGELSLSVMHASEIFDKIVDARHNSGSNTSQLELDN